MRGKNILWIALIAALLCPGIISAVKAPTMPTMYIDPPATLGINPGDLFVVNVQVSDVADLYAWEFELSFAPFSNVIRPIDVVEGDIDSNFTAVRTDNFAGWMIVGGIIDPDPYTGSGALMTITFTILEAGSSQLNLHDTTLADSNLDLIPHNVVDGYYQGTEANLDRLLGTARGRKAPFYPGNTTYQKAKVVNNGWLPLYTRLKYTSVRGDDGKTTTIYSGQQYMSTIVYSTVYLYVNEVMPVFEEWTEVGTSPYLDAAGDGSYVRGTTYCQLSNVYGFDDVTLGSLDKIKEVRLEGYTQADSTDIDYDVYVWDSFAWLGSLWGDAAYAWRNPRWETRSVDTILPSTKTQAGLNSLQLLLHYYTPDGSPMGNADMDAMRLKVTIETGGIVPAVPPFYLVQPGEKAVLPEAIWYLGAADVGEYTTTVSMEYRYNFPDPRFEQVWQTGDTIYSFSWSVEEVEP